MKNLPNSIFLFMLVIWFMGSFRSPDIEPTLQVGVARVNITPETPIRMSGYGNRKEPFKGVHDSIYAGALVFEYSDEKVAIISADVIGFSHSFVDQVKESINTATGIAEDHISVIAVHNHGGPVTSVYTDDSSDDEIAYYDELKSKLTQAVQTAASNMQPGKIGVGKGTCSMNVNRRARHAEGGIWLGRNPAGPCDREVGVLRIDDLSDRPIAAFVNWPCHATVGGQGNYLITGDWPGAAAKEFTNHTKTLVLMTAGASADINPIYGPNTKFNDITSIGQILSEEMVRIFSEVKTHPVKGLEIMESEINAAGKKRSESRMPNVSLTKDEDEYIRISALRLGNVVLAGISGELMTEIGLFIKEHSPYKNTFIVTHCNGSSGYLCTDQAYLEGGYEPMVSRTMPGTEEKIKGGVLELINRL